VLWLSVWLFVELFLANVILRLAGSTWQIPVPAGMAELIARSSDGDRPPLYILVLIAAFTIVWTLGGPPRIAEVLRLLVGSDTVTMSADELHVRRAIGPWAVESHWPKADITSIVIRGRARRLEGQAGAQRFVISTLGSEGERKTLGDELRARYVATGPKERGLPPGWETLGHATGTLRLRPPRGILGMGTVVEVGRDSLVLSRSIGPWKTRREFRLATFVLSFLGNGARSFKLDVGRGDQWRALAYATDDATDLLRLGRFLAAETGWPLEIDQYVKDAGVA
jgi:hypothetical protein